MYTCTCTHSSICHCVCRTVKNSFVSWLIELVKGFKGNFCAGECLTKCDSKILSRRFSRRIMPVLSVKTTRNLILKQKQLPQLCLELATATKPGNSHKARVWAHATQIFLWFSSSVAKGRPGGFQKP